MSGRHPATAEATACGMDASHSSPNSSMNAERTRPIWPSKLRRLSTTVSCAISSSRMKGLSASILWINPEVEGCYANLQSSVFVFGRQASMGSDIDAT